MENKLKPVCPLSNKHTTYFVSVNGIVYVCCAECKKQYKLLQKSVRMSDGVDLSEREIEIVTGSIKDKIYYDQEKLFKVAWDIGDAITNKDFKSAEWFKSYKKQLLNRIEECEKILKKIS